MMIDAVSMTPIAVPCLALLVWHLRTRHRFSIGRLIAVVIFATYLLLVSDYTIFPLQFDAAYIERHRSWNRFLDGINLVPLKDLSFEYLVSVQGWGNVALGVPFGFVYPFVMPVSGWRSIARYGFFFSAAIELTQLAISLLYRFTYRVIDVNDILLNVPGVLFGYALLTATALAFVYQKVSGQNPRESKFPDEGVWSHIESVLLKPASPHVT
jgi:glycopeptide antibiotics resistance protein